MTDIKEVVNEQEIFNILEKTRNPSCNAVADILNKASNKNGLSLSDAGYLLNAEDPELIGSMFRTSGRIKNDIYGERLVLFAPLYLSSFCINDCGYCGFHLSNPAPRKKLTLEEVAEQTKTLVDMGHKRLLLEFGEHPKINPIDYVLDVINTIYGIKSNNGEIGRLI